MRPLTGTLVHIWLLPIVMFLSVDPQESERLKVTLPIQMATAEEN